MEAELFALEKQVSDRMEELCDRIGRTFKRKDENDIHGIRRLFNSLVEIDGREYFRVLLPGGTSEQWIPPENKALRKELTFIYSGLSAHKKDIHRAIKERRMPKKSEAMEAIHRFGDYLCHTLLDYIVKQEIREEKEEGVPEGINVLPAEIKKMIVTFLAEEKDEMRKIARLNKQFLDLSSEERAELTKRYRTLEEKLPELRREGIKSMSQNLLINIFFSMGEFGVQFLEQCEKNPTVLFQVTSREGMFFLHDDAYKQCFAPAFRKNATIGRDPLFQRPGGWHLVTVYDLLSSAGQELSATQLYFVMKDFFQNLMDVYPLSCIIIRVTPKEGINGFYWTKPSDTPFDVVLRFDLFEKRMGALMLQTRDILALVSSFAFKDTSMRAKNSWFDDSLLLQFGTKETSQIAETLAGLERTKYITESWNAFINYRIDRMFGRKGDPDYPFK